MLLALGTPSAFRAAELGGFTRPPGWLVSRAGRPVACGSGSFIAGAHRALSPVPGTGGSEVNKTERFPHGTSVRVDRLAGTWNGGRHRIQITAGRREGPEGDTCSSGI